MERPYWFFESTFIFKKYYGNVKYMYEGMQFENLDAFEKDKELLINCYPYVSRNLSEKELSEAKMSYELD